MRTIRKIIVLCLMSAVCIGTASAQRRLSAEEYIEKYKRLAIEEQEIYGIPASIKMAQALVESDCGNSRLATLANNHFGIKWKKEWTGETILHDDDRVKEPFRKYASVEESFRDHSEFLDKSTRYESLFRLDPTDYKGWARGLKECGYATNPKYADILIGMIERYDLHRLDSESPMGQIAQQPTVAARDYAAAIAVAPESEAGIMSRVDVDNYAVSANRLGSHQVFYNNGSEFVVARGGETYESIATLARSKAKRLRKFNDAPANYQPEEGEQVYIRAKAGRSNNGKLIHVAEKGETLRYVSQLYGIKLNKLARINRMSINDVINKGQQIRLM